jgi:hypothetical protein
VLRTLGLDIIGPSSPTGRAEPPDLTRCGRSSSPGRCPGIGVLVDYVRWRTVDVVDVVVLSGIGISIVLAIVTNDPDVVLLESAAITAIFGTACLVSLSARRPLIFYFGQAFYGGRHSFEGAEMDADYEKYEEARYFWRIVTAVWGLTHIALAAALAAIVQTSSTSTALTFNRTVPWILNGGLIAWSVWWVNACGRRTRAKTSRQPTDPSGSAQVGMRLGDRDRRAAGPRLDEVLPHGLAVEPVQPGHDDLLGVAGRTGVRLWIVGDVRLDEVGIGDPELQDLAAVVIPSQPGELLLPYEQRG